MSTQPESGDNWSREEVEATVADYLSMLAAELRGEDYNKAEHNRNLKKFVRRSRGSIELKHQNISAVLMELDMPWINGYKPRANYQNLLREVVVDQLVTDRYAVRATADTIVAAVPPSLVRPASFAGVQVDPPEPARDFKVRQPPPKRERVPVLKNYLEIDARNRALGAAGEEFVVLFEERRLFDAGRRDLAKQIEHVAASRGDGLGYDVSSFELDGRPRLIEVKTTSFGAMTPFYVSKYEVGASNRLAESYQLYRLFNFKRRAQFFALAGSLQKRCHLEPEQFLARVV